ncbi:antibiotic biosynthesis monooxygenase [Micromonospora sp. WMMD1120]|uniref:putative quinol monooxygenase n=1 Tax=Micromonospora sp. WMMD1120 TaxID=3016106 RepID=UPI0024160FD8|nr:antibiotic biosynthesis monooxygenase family protein [Micromonospora sp. WMMD1120]MDG4808073.1 antibiotic biosynthesis monooxygenase [Micromonospora sp. WMMD1120]
MLIIAGSLRVDPAAREGYLADCATVITQARATPGCLDFLLAADPLEPDRIHVYERWESPERLAAFRGSGPDDVQTAAILDADVRRYLIAGVEAP